MKRPRITGQILLIMIFGGHFLLGLQLNTQPSSIRYSPLPAAPGLAKELRLSLNGDWSFHPAPPDQFWHFRNPPKSWSKIRVPGDWTMQGFSVKPHTAAGYWKSFIVPAGWRGSRIKLRADGVQSEAKIWVNGKPAGSHLGGFTAFEMDITELLNSGGDNTIALAVTNESLADELASSTQYAAYQIGGITRKIYLAALPAINISSLKIETDFDPGYKDATLRVRYEVRNEGKLKADRIGCFFSASDLGGNPLMLGNNGAEELSRASGGSVREVFEAKVRDPHPWDPEHPNLYVLTAELRKGDDILETVKQRFGFREVEVVGNQVYINGRPVKLRGVNRHESHPLLGRSLSPELWRRDAELFRDANVNYIRTSHYPPAEEFLDICDELGLFVELEAPLVWVGHGANSRWGKDDPHSEAIRPLILQEIAEAVAFNWNHPSVIIWSLANESAWGPNWAEAQRLAAGLDPTRPQSFHDQAYGEYNNYGSTSLPIANYHYPGPKGPERAAGFERPILFGEYCHINTYNRQELAADPGVRDDYGIGFSRMWEKMLATRAVLGGAVWCGIDDIFYLPTGKTVGYGPWGIIDGWRRTKPEYWHVKKTYSPVRVHTTAVRVPAAGEPVELQVSNRHDFTNLKELKIEWRIEDEKGEAQVDLAPRQTGVLKIYPKAARLDGKKLRLDFMSPRGFLIDSEMISIGEAGPPPLPYQMLQENALGLKDNGGYYSVSGNRFSLELDKSSGQIKDAKIDNIAVLVGGPALMILPQNSGPCQPDYIPDTQPLNDTCSDWRVEGVEARAEDGAVIITVKGEYKEAAGQYSIKVDPKEGIEVSYSFVARMKLNPRQFGMVLDLPASYNKLNWKRNAQWSIYPENHIGRPEGSASASIPGNESKFRQEPKNEWKDDQNALGTNDFRSTKGNILWASLTSKEGHGLVLLSDGRHSCRAFLDGERIRFLIADFTTGGGDMFFAAHHQDRDKPLEIGDPIKGAFKFKFIY